MKVVQTSTRIDLDLLKGVEEKGRQLNIFLTLSVAFYFVRLIVLLCLVVASDERLSKKGKITHDEQLMLIVLACIGCFAVISLAIQVKN